MSQLGFLWFGAGMDGLSWIKAGHLGLPGSAAEVRAKTPCPQVATFTVKDL